MATGFDFYINAYQNSLHHPCVRYKMSPSSPVNHQQHVDHTIRSIVGNGLPGTPVLNAVDGTSYKNFDHFLETSALIQDSPLKRKTKTLKRILAYEIADNKKLEKNKEILRENAILVLPVDNKFGLEIKICRKTEAEQLFQENKRQLEALELKNSIQNLVTQFEQYRRA